MHGTVALIAFVTCGASYVVFLLWYGGRGRPMTEDEAASRVELIERTAHAAGVVGADLGLLEALREVGRNDDGREFVMVNLIKYRPKAVYPPGYSYGDDARAAEMRYNRAVVPLAAEASVHSACFWSHGRPVPCSGRLRGMG